MMMRWNVLLGFLFVIAALHLGHSSAQDSEGKNYLAVLKGPFRPGAAMPDWNVGGEHQEHLARHVSILEETAW